MNYFRFGSLLDFNFDEGSQTDELFRDLRELVDRNEVTDAEIRHALVDAAYKIQTSRFRGKSCVIVNDVDENYAESVTRALAFWVLREDVAARWPGITYVHFEFGASSLHTSYQSSAIGKITIYDEYATILIRGYQPITRRHSVSRAELIECATAMANYTKNSDSTQFPHDEDPVDRADAKIRRRAHYRHVCVHGRHGKFAEFRTSYWRHDLSYSPYVLMSVPRGWIISRRALRPGN
jgi:hypothetical protein